jgi:hypothetical protein
MEGMICCAACSSKCDQHHSQTSLRTKQNGTDAVNEVLRCFILVPGAHTVSKFTEIREQINRLQRRFFEFFQARDAPD